MKGHTLFAAALVFTALPAFAQPIKLLDAADFGEAWPFTTEEMHLLCLPGKAVVASDPETGRMYALNGQAKLMAGQLGLELLDAVWRPNQEIPGTKISVGPMIEQGLALCD